MNQFNILIVEDEVLVAKDLAMRLTKMGLNTSLVANNATVALDLLRNNPFDIAILDIQINDHIDGISLAHQINYYWPMPIIFLTSFSDKLTIARAKDAHPSAYMLKPFNDRELAISIELALANYSHSRFAKTHQYTSSERKSENSIHNLNESLFLRKKDRFERVEFSDIFWAEAQSNYTEIVCEQAKFVIAITLQEVAIQLNASCFIRTHRSFVVNLNKVNSLEGNTLYIGKKSIPVSKSRREEVFKRFRKM